MEVRPNSGIERYFLDSYGTDDDAVREGFRWLLRFAAEHDYSQATIFVYGLAQIENLGPALGKRLAGELKRNRSAPVDGITVEARIKRERTRALGRGDGPVLAVWANDTDLLDMLDNWRVPAICAIPWDHINDWKARWSPTDIRTGNAAEVSETVTNPVVVQALKAVTQRANLANGMDTYNRDAAGQAFRLLRRAGEGFDHEQVRAWAAQNGWGSHNARKLGDLALAINEDRPVRVGQRPVWTEGTVDHWRELASPATDA
jgi:hypothetical protein